MRRNYSHGEAYKRRGPVREPYDTVLIVCEGEKTEPNYFEGLKAACRLSSANIEVTNAPGTDPMTIVSYTEGLMQKTEFDRVFSVFDRDGHVQFDAALQRVQNSVRGRQQTWQAITSTPCFELWLILHFGYFSAPIVKSGNNSAGDLTCRKLKEFFPGYKKNDKGIYDRVAALTDDAIIHAERLVVHNAANGSVNPATGMHILIQYLRGLKR